MEAKIDMPFLKAQHWIGIAPEGALLDTNFLRPSRAVIAALLHVPLLLSLGGEA